MKSLKQILSEQNATNFPFEGKCFICYASLNEDNSSKEHIFPKWVLKKFDLFNSSLRIVNGSTIKYSQLTIPACRDCNNEHLAKLEIDTKNLYENRFQNLNRKDEITLAQWSAKILLGSVFKETSLSSNIKEKSSNNIVNKTWLDTFDILYAVLQTTKYKYEIKGEKPWSIFSMEFMDNEFRYLADVLNKAISIQLGKTGFMIIFEESNFVNKLWKLKEYRAKMGGKLSLKEVTENIMRMNLATIIVIPSSINKFNKTSLKYSFKEEKLTFTTKRTKRFDIRWTETETKLLNKIWKSTFPGELINEKKKFINELINAKENSKQMRPQNTDFKMRRMNTGRRLT